MAVTLHTSPTRLAGGLVCMFALCLSFEIGSYSIPQDGLELITQCVLASHSHQYFLGLASARLTGTKCHTKVICQVRWGQWPFWRVQPKWGSQSTASIVGAHREMNVDTQFPFFFYPVQDHSPCHCATRIEGESSSHVHYPNPGTPTYTSKG